MIGVALIGSATVSAGSMLLSYMSGTPFPLYKIDRQISPNHKTF